MGSRKEVIIADVAEETNVSKTTVSRVLNQRAGSIQISEETKERIFEAAHRLGYEPNPFAAALRTRRTGLIGVVVRDIGDPFLSRLVRELQAIASQEGIELLLAHANHDIAIAGRQVNRMLGRYFDGLLLLGDIPGDTNLIEHLARSGKPFVSIARGFDDDAPMINVDEAAGTRLALDYLISLGHRKVAFLGGVENIGIQERLSIFKDYIKEIGLAWDESYLGLCANRFGEASEKARTLMALPEPPTAIFCATDRIALGAMKAAHGEGVAVPGGISIIGFDNIDAASEATPALTTIDQPAELMAAQAVESLRTLVSGGSLPQSSQIVVARPTLIVRDSCAPPQHVEAGRILAYT